MKRLSTFAAAAGLLLATSAAANAGITVTTGGTLVPGNVTSNNGLYSNEANVSHVEFNFGLGDLPKTYTFASSYTATYTGNGKLVQGSLPGFYANPAPNDNSGYLTTPAVLGQDNTVVAKLNFYSDYFGLQWGSLDSFNTIAFYSNGTLLKEFTGTDIAAIGATVADGNQQNNCVQGTGNQNCYWNFFFSGDTPLFNEIHFSSGQYAFESDNHAYRAVPEPITIGLIGTSLVGLAALRRRRSA